MNRQIRSECGCWTHADFPDVVFPCALHSDVPAAPAVKVDPVALEQEELRAEAEAWRKWSR